MILFYKKDDNTWITETYRKVENTASVKQSCTNVNFFIQKLDLRIRTPRVILKIIYHFDGDPAKLVIRDQKGREIFSSGRLSTKTIQEHEILFADLPEVLEITELISVVNLV